MQELTKPEATQIHASSVGELIVTWRLGKTRCCYQCWNIIPWDAGANQNAPNNASLKKWSGLHRVLQMQRIMRNLKGYLKNNFWRKWAATVKKKKIVVVFADLFLLYVYYVFTLVLFSYKNYSIQKLCRKENCKRSFFYFTRIFFILSFLYEIETTS